MVENQSRSKGCSHTILFQQAQWHEFMPGECMKEPTHLIDKIIGAVINPWFRAASSQLTCGGVPRIEKRRNAVW